MYYNPVRPGNSPAARTVESRQSGRLRGREDELRAVYCTAVVGSGEVNNRRATNGCTNDNGDDKNEQRNIL